MLFTAILAISTAAPILVIADMPPAVIAFWRCGLAGLALLGWARLREPGALGRLSRADLGRLAVAGTLLGIHFLLWISSLSRTSILASTVLVTTNPIWVAVGAWLFLREPSTRTTWAAIAVGLGGTVLLALAGGVGAEGPEATMLGNALALGAAIAGSGALLIARRLRARIPYATFAAVEVLFAVPLLAVATLVGGHSFLPATALQWSCVLGVALIPQLIGNTALTWAVEWLPAPRVALVILGEPVGATLLAWGFLAQRPAPLAIAGGALIMAAVLVAARQPIRPAADAGS